MHVSVLETVSHHLLEHWLWCIDKERNTLSVDV